MRGLFPLTHTRKGLTKMENVKIAMKAIQEEINETTLIITACKRPPQWFIDHLDRLQKAHLSLQDVARQMPEITESGTD